MSEYRFRVEIREGRGGGAWVEIPLDVREEFGTGGRVAVVATFDGEPYRGSIAPMGGGVHVLGIRKEIRAKLGKGIGDEVELVLRRDTEPRTVEPPAELAAAFAESPEAKRTYDGLSYTHRREYAEWVGGAKKSETRERRARKTIEKLLTNRA